MSQLMGMVEEQRHLFAKRVVGGVEGVTPTLFRDRQHWPLAE